MLCLRILAVCCLSSWIILCTGLEAEEPLCLSRYDYDYKLLTKIVAIETELGRFHEALETEVSSMKASADKVSRLEKMLSAVERAVSMDGSGATYVHWGRTTCPGNGTEKIYEGYAAGSHYTHSGAAVDYLCLPTEPIWDLYDDTFQNSAFVFGAEYQTTVGQTVNMNQDVPCAVCRTKRATTVMIPGRNICYDGWTREYHGYLSADHYTHTAASQYACLDKTPEVLPGGQSDLNGILFYFVESNCGSLRCPPYVNGRELTCVVCYKQSVQIT